MYGSVFCIGIYPFLLIVSTRNHTAFFQLLLLLWYQSLGLGDVEVLYTYVNEWMERQYSAAPMISLCVWWYHLQINKQVDDSTSKFYVFSWQKGKKIHNIGIRNNNMKAQIKYTWFLFPLDAHRVVNTPNAFLYVRGLKGKMVEVKTEREQ